MNIEGLRSRISGDVVAPGDPNWNEARLAWNLAVDQRPALVVLPESADDVIEIVEHARAYGYRRTVVAIVEAGAESGAPLLSVEIRHLGGALARSKPEHGALDRMEAEFLSFAVGMAPDASAKAAVHEAIRRLQSALAPWEARHMYLNFSDQRKDVRRLFPFDVYRRLAVTKARWDAGELFRSNHPIPPATIVSRRPRRALVRRAPGRAARSVSAAR